MKKFREGVKTTAIVLLVLMGLASCSVVLFNSHAEDGMLPAK